MRFPGCRWSPVGPHERRRPARAAHGAVRAFGASGYTARSIPEGRMDSRFASDQRLA